MTKAFWTSGAWAVLASALMLAWVAYQNRTEDQIAGAAPFRAVDGLDATPEQRAAIEDLLVEAYAVLRSSEFEENLSALDGAYPQVYARPDEQSLPPSEVAKIVSLKKLGVRYGRSEVLLVSEEARSEGWAARAGPVGESGRYAAIELSRGVLEDYRSSDVVERSCAINVAAHEYAHTISLTPVVFTMAFRDTRGDGRIANRRYPGTPVASYLIGSVAQCTWLQKVGRVARTEIPGCVQVFGVAAFNASRCWSFRGGERVTPRRGLPAARRPL